MNHNIHLLIIDPQIDFCMPNGSLYIDGAEKDIDRLVNFIYKKAKDISKITVTLDSHKYYHIANQIFWVNKDGNNPEPFTIITEDDVNHGVWKATKNIHSNWAIEYVNTLSKNNRYKLCIWPYHCIIGTYGHSIYPALSEALKVYETEYNGEVTYINKGENSLTEHYSALCADVPISNDDATNLNNSFLESIKQSEKVYISGQALSHCVANTILDISYALDDDLSKFTLLTDTSSSVKGFEYLSDDFIYKAKNIGLKLTTTIDEI